MRRKTTKRRANKPVPKKRKAKRQPKPLVTKTPRGRNRLVIEFPEGKKTVEEVEVYLITFDWKKLNYLLRKNKNYNPLFKRYFPKPPQGITVIIEIKKNKQKYFFTRISPLDMVVNKKNIQEFVAKTLQDLENNWSAAKEAMQDEESEADIDGAPAEYVEKLDPRFIKSITIHFLY